MVRDFESLNGLVNSLQTERNDVNKIYKKKSNKFVVPEMITVSSFAIYFHLMMNEYS